MAVIRVNKTKDYTIINNNCFKNKDMSLKAKGLLSLMLSLPENWNYTVSGLVSICKESETSIKSTLNELKKFGYLTITKKKPNETSSGRFEYEYDIYEKPQKQEGKKQGVENQPLEILGVEILGAENHPLYKDTNISNTNNTDIKSTFVDSVADFDFQSVLNSFNAICISLPKVQKLTPNRKKRIKDLKKNLGKLTFDEFFTMIEQSDFLTGRNGIWYNCNFDWCIKPANYIKILEGNYRNKTSKEEPQNKGVSYDIDELENYSMFDDEV